MEYDSFHPTHVLNNIPYNLAKRIIVFTSDSSKEKKDLNNLREWLLESKYPLKVIQKAFHNAKLQGPAPNPKNKKQVIPLVSKHSSNFSNKNIVKQANVLLNRCPDTDTKKKFETKEVIFAQRQPPNLLKMLTNAKFTSTNKKINGQYKCTEKRCKLCKSYIEECTSFITSKGTEWHIKSHITCGSKMVICFLKCYFCNYVTNIGKTNDLRARMNNHISACRLGSSSDKFDNHVFMCNNNKENKPYFTIYVMMELNDVDKLLVYEHYLHPNGHDTINRNIAKSN